VAERDVFLAAVSEGWSATSASERAGADRKRFYELKAEDEAFAEQWAEAYEQATQMLEDELRRRSVEGWDEETFDGDGKLLRRVRRMLPHDLHLQLKARRPEVYRENARVDVRAGIDLPSLESSLGRPVTSLKDVIERAQELGLGHLIGLDVVRDGVPEPARALSAGDDAAVDGEWRPVSSDGGRAR
jgi:hypothetical protein